LHSGEKLEHPNVEQLFHLVLRPQESRPAKRASLFNLTQKLDHLKLYASSSQFFHFLLTKPVGLCKNTLLDTEISISSEIENPILPNPSSNEIRPAQMELAQNERGWRSITASEKVMCMNGGSALKGLKT
jgi:hypothetical protein